MLPSHLAPLCFGRIIGFSPCCATRRSSRSGVPTAPVPLCRSRSCIQSERSADSPTSCCILRRRPNAVWIPACAACWRRWPGKKSTTAARLHQYQRCLWRLRRARIDETRPPHPNVPAPCVALMPNTSCVAFGRQNGVRVSILRAPGIYAADRLPTRALQKGPCAAGRRRRVHQPHPCRRPGHAELRGAAPRTRQPLLQRDRRLAMKMGEYFDLVADRFGLPRPPRISRSEARKNVGAFSCRS
jgi:hypothetical protein